MLTICAGHHFVNAAVSLLAMGGESISEEHIYFHLTDSTTMRFLFIFLSGLWHRGRLDYAMIILPLPLPSREEDFSKHDYDRLLAFFFCLLGHELVVIATECAGLSLSLICFVFWWHTFAIFCFS